MSKILVTGGAGFIGSNLVDNLLRLQNENDEVKIVVLDALTYAGNPDNLPVSPNVSLIVGDVRNQELVEKLVSEADCVYHLAAESHVDRSIEGSRIFMETNVIGTLNVLEGVRKFHKKLVIVSTDEVYGSIESGFADETSMLNPSSPYSASKASADLLALSYFQTFGTYVIITRCSNNYGPKQFPEKLIPLIISKALKGEKIPVYGDGLNVRDWIHVNDHCEGLVLAMKFGKPGRIYNFGNVEHVRNIDLVKRILSILDKPENLIEFVPDRLGHDFRYAISADRAIMELHWKAKLNFESNLVETVNSYC